jgi:hypothetical protein
MIDRLRVRLDAGPSMEAEIHRHGMHPGPRGDDEVIHPFPPAGQSGLIR